MTKTTFDEIYGNIPQHQREQLREFRSSHPTKDHPVDGTTWNYISCGKGESLVLLPGGIRLAETWFKFITALEDRYRIISPTYPSVETMDGILKGIASILESEKIQKAHMVGTSFGGMIAQCFVRKYPDRVKTLILSNTMGPQGISRTLIRLGQIVTSIYPNVLIRMALQRNYLKILSVTDENREFWKAYLKELSLKTTKEDILAQQKCSLDFVACSFTKDDLVNWDGRILILESDDDPAIKPSARENLKALYPSARIHTFHNAGHTPGYSNPGEYISVVTNFLDE